MNKQFLFFCFFSTLFFQTFSFQKESIMNKKNNSRIMIFGIPGAGKSTFALKLHKQTNIPVFHLDKYMFLPGGKKRDEQEFLKMQQEMVNKDEWIIDGASVNSFEMRWKRATSVIYFNYPFWVCLWRVLKRQFSKDKSIDDRADGKQEMISWRMVKYMWRYNKRVQPIIEELKSKYSDTQFYEVTNDKEFAEI